MDLSRREALRLGLTGSGGLLLPFGVVERALASEPCPKKSACKPHGMHEPAGPYKPTRFSPQIPRFKRPFEPLTVRSAKRLRPDLDGCRLTMQQATVEIVPGKPTTVWTCDGLLPGPCIRQDKDRDSMVRFVIKLHDATGAGVSTSIHLHGMASLPQYDGYAEDLIPENSYKDSYYPTTRRAPSGITTTPSATPPATSTWVWPACTWSSTTTAISAIPARRNVCPPASSTSPW
jgi:FtsP/CotA-like multicopper oxidase with cupredoxin domain